MTCYLFSRTRKYFCIFAFFLFLPLFLFKYLNLAIDLGFHLPNFMIVHFINAPVPPGLSFATFSAFAMLAIYRQNKQEVGSINIISGYLLFFPQLIAGPIVMPNHLIPQLKKLNIVEYKNILYGIFIFSVGFMLKTVFADTAAQYVDPIMTSIKNASTDEIAIATFLFSQQIFFDFNGYTLMAIGIAYSFGIKLPENFNAPYLATSVSDFWRKWHITLSNWIKDFIYIPLGGSRCGRFRNFKNIIIAMLISGIWHGYGITFVVWGFLHGGFIVLEKIFVFSFIPRPIKIAFTYFLISILWVFFRVEHLEDVVYIFENIKFSSTSYYFFFVVSGCFLLNYFQQFITISELDKFYHRINKIVLMTISVFLIIFCIILSEGSSQKFIYFNF